jgi:hypothetical protein
MGEVTVNITGYRQLSTQEQELINELKTQGNELGVALDVIEQMPDIDKRWLSIGRTHMQQGLMAIIRAIARPNSF